MLAIRIVVERGVSTSWKLVDTGTRTMPKLPKDLAALTLVHFGLFAASFADAWFVHTQSPKLPIGDEWDMLYSWVESPTTWHWIWEHHNEHRYPLAKSVWLGTLRATEYDFAAPQYISLVLLISTAVLFVWTARGLRGRAHPVDLLFPALLLHFGHGNNLQMGYSVGFILLAYSLAGWLWCAGRLSQGGGWGWDFGGALYAGLAIPCGGFGLAFTPVVLFWFFYRGRQAKRSGKTLLAGYFAILFALALGYSAWIALTLPGFKVETGVSPLDQPGDFLTGVAGYLASALGCWSIRDYSQSWVVVAAAIPVLLTYAIGFRVLANRIDDADPRRSILVVTILLVMLGTVLTGAAAARARGFGLSERFATPSAVGLSAAVLALIAGGSPRRGGRLSHAIGGVSAVLAVSLIYANIESGLNWAYRMRHSIHYLDADMRAGQPPMFLAGRHGGAIGILMGDRLGPQLIAFQRYGTPQFAGLPNDPRFRTVPLALDSLPVTWKLTGAEFESGAPPPRLKIPPPPARAIALRVRTVTVILCGEQKLALITPGQSNPAEAHPCYFIGPSDLIFPVSGSQVELELRAASPLEKLRIERAEWLIAE